MYKALQAFKETWVMSWYRELPVGAFGIPTVTICFIIHLDLKQDTVDLNGTSTISKAISYEHCYFRTEELLANVSLEFVYPTTDNPPKLLSTQIGRIRQQVGKYYPVMVEGLC